MEQGIQLGFIKTLEFRGGFELPPPLYSTVVQGPSWEPSKSSGSQES
jgi:hypothetical protein